MTLSPVCGSREAKVDELAVSCLVHMVGSLLRYFRPLPRRELIGSTTQGEANGGSSEAVLGEPRGGPPRRGSRQPGVQAELPQIPTAHLAAAGRPPSTDRWSSKWGVVKNGNVSSWTSACLSPTEPTQITIRSSYRSLVSGSTASGEGCGKTRRTCRPSGRRVASAASRDRHVWHRSGEYVELLDRGSPVGLRRSVRSSSHLPGRFSRVRHGRACRDDVGRPRDHVRGCRVSSASAVRRRLRHEPVVRPNLR